MPLPPMFEPHPDGWLLTREVLDSLTVFRRDPETAQVEPITAAAVAPDEGVDQGGYGDSYGPGEDRFAPEVLDELRRLGDTYGPLGVAIAAASLTDAQALTAAIRDGHTGGEANVAGLYATIDDLRRRARSDEAEHLRRAAEWDRRSAEGRAQVDRLVDSNAALRIANEVLRAEQRAEQEAAEEQADALRSEVARLSGLLDEARRQTIEAETYLRELKRSLHEPAEPERPHPAANAWPDDAVTITYAEARSLVALHLDTLARTLGKVAPWDDARRTAAAMRDGETPLLLSEVLDR